MSRRRAPERPAADDAVAPDAGARAARRRGAAARAYDVVLYGATGFVGRQTVAYFAAHAPRGLRWALAGRSAERLERVREACGPGAAGAGIVVADALDAGALDALAARTRVVASTAGPFALYGDGLVDACVAHRTHYVDITGETPWVRRLIDRHHARAAADATRIVPCCGFDSVPSDLGAWLVASAIRSRFGEPCVEVRASFSMRGGVNGGTLASALNLMDAGDAGRLADPFLLNPPGTAPRGGARHADPTLPVHDPDFDAWLGPFVMGPVNTRVVRRSAALLAQGDAPAYDRDFRYQEYQRVGRPRERERRLADEGRRRAVAGVAARAGSCRRPAKARPRRRWTAARSAASSSAARRAGTSCAAASPAAATPATARRRPSSARRRSRSRGRPTRCPPAPARAAC